MITVWGGQTSRSIRVVWVLEEMGLPYCVRQVDMLAVEQDPEFLAVNPADYIPAIKDGDAVMGRVDRHHGIPDGALRADAAGTCVK